MLEYVLVFTALVALVAVCVWFARAARQCARDTALVVTNDAP